MVTSVRSAHDDYREMCKKTFSLSDVANYQSWAYHRATNSLQPSVQTELRTEENGSVDLTGSSLPASSSLIKWRGKQWFSMLELTSEVVNILECSSVQMKKKKNVSFADENGAQLVTITVISEPSDVPPILKSKVVHALLSEYDLSASRVDELSNETHWIIDFAQPCLNHSSFHETLRRQRVQLASAMLQSDCSRLKGTVKVQNLSFEKSVFARYTLDNWMTFADVPAEHVSSCRDDHDVFAFYLNLPRKTTSQNGRLEFCVGYYVCGQQYWDNNFNKNYEVVSHARQEYEKATVAICREQVWQADKASATNCAASPIADSFLATSWQYQYDVQYW